MSDQNTCIDTTGYVWFVETCGDVVDPCVADGNSTLFLVRICGPDNPPLPEWCQTHSDHPACVQNGLSQPPMPAVPVTGDALPVTGSADVLPVAAGGLLLAGLLCMVASRRRVRVRH